MPDPIGRSIIAMVLIGIATVVEAIGGRVLDSVLSWHRLI